MPSIFIEETIIASSTFITENEVEITSENVNSSSTLPSVQRFDVYYKDGQDLDACYVANVAKRV